MNVHFEEYLQAIERYDLHPRCGRMMDKCPSDIREFRHLIMYGPSGVGKYTQALRLIRRYSPSKLKYQKKMVVTVTKKMSYCCRFSDVHYEVDMSLLGCNAKMLWSVLFQHIVEIIAAKSLRVGIVLCKHVDATHRELLDQLHAFMHPLMQGVTVHFLLLADHLCGLPSSLLCHCEVMRVPRPTSRQYQLALNISSNISALGPITNMKVSPLDKQAAAMMHPHRLLGDKLMRMMLSPLANFPFLAVRDTIYDMFIYHISLEDTVWHILTTWVREQHLPATQMQDVYWKTYRFLQYYNNNYRPIYHVESYVLYLVMVAQRILPTSTHPPALLPCASCQR